MIICIVGPTGVGKTKLSVELAKKLNAEIINADSMQVYRHLDIATAKIKEEEKEGIPHHLFDIVDPEDIYTVYDYQKDCRKKIKEISSRGKNIILVGGTGLYLKAALFDYRFPKEEKTEKESLSTEELITRLHQYTDHIDVDLHNQRRLQRLLERYENGTVEEKKGDQPLYDFKIIGLTLDRDVLYQRINQRVDQMVEEGVIEEARSFYDQNLRSKALLTGIGYKELYSYFDGECSKEEAIEKIKQNSRRYAKRQYTFFNHQFKDIVWLSVNLNHFEQTVEEALDIIRK
jgi:tRNA dimethylallyltransferase